MKPILAGVLGIYLALSCPAARSQPAGSDPGRGVDCNVTAEEVKVFSAVLESQKNIPKDRDELLVLDTTVAAEGKSLFGSARNRSGTYVAENKTIPADETVVDYESQVKTSCRLNSPLKLNKTYQLVSYETIRGFFQSDPNKIFEGWREFQKNFPKT
jgi:hypothetical protein